MRRRWPRAVAAALVACGAGALGVGFLAAGPALAAPAAPAATPPPCGLLNACPPDPGVVSGSPGSAGGTITVTWKSPAGMFPDTTSTAPLTITWTPVGTAPPLVPAPPVTVFTESGVCASPANSPDLTCTYAWPGALMVNKFVLNGTYSLSAAADDCPLLGPCSKPQAIDPKFQSLAVTNAPAAPTKVTAALVQNSAAVKISWAANPEPDIVGYQVLRGDNSVACQVPAAAANPTTYSCVDAPTKDGKYAYSVVAYRWGATYSTALKDEQASPHSTATAALTVVGTSANTTTTVAAGTAGTLGPAGFVPRLTPSNIGGGGGAAFNPKLAPAVTAPAAPVDTPANGDTGFLPSLPYGQRAAPPTTTDPAVIPVPAAPHKAKSTSVGSIAVVGAGLLVAVIALHGLWLRSEVRRSGALEVLEPRA